MVKKAAELQKTTVAGLRGGKGELVKTILGDAGESFGHISLFATFTIPAGASIGRHTHETNAEYYYVLSGTLTLDEDGVVTELHPGDVSLCRDGKGHSIQNNTDADAVILALIVEQ